MTLRLVEEVRAAREYLYDFNEKDLGELNLYIIKHSLDKVDFVTMDDVAEAFTGSEPLPTVHFDNRNYPVNLNEFVSEWCIEGIWDTVTPDEIDCETIETDTSIYKR